MTWLELYEAASNEGAVAGYYNDNVRVETPDGALNVRIPIPGSAAMDLRLWPESQLVAAIQDAVPGMPRLRYAHPDPAFQVYDYVRGDVVDIVYPPGVRLPRHVLDDVVRFFAHLVTIPPESLPPTPGDWPSGRDTRGVGARLIDFTTSLYAAFREPFGELYRGFGVPDDPCEPARQPLARLGERPLRLIHADVHRQNLIVDHGATTFIDWELALLGDPVYDLVINVQRMGYRPDEAAYVIATWSRALPPEFTVGWDIDLPAYQIHEKVKSAVVDVVRWARHFAFDNVGAEREHALATELAGTLNAAHTYWESGRTIDTAEVTAALVRWANAHGTRPDWPSPSARHGRSGLADAAAGYYNSNVRVDTRLGSLNVRTPIPGADVMDLRIWPEKQVLDATQDVVPCVPRLLYTHGDPAFHLHEYVVGDVLDSVFPRGVRLPRHVLDDVVRLLSSLSTFPVQRLPATPAGWPTGRDTRGFGERLAEFVTSVYETHQERFSTLYHALGVPADPVAPARAMLATLSARPLTLVHGDLHRKNMIVNAGVTTFLDWELALLGDPVYDLAVHVAKMGYQRDEQEYVIMGWRRALGPAAIAGWEADLHKYLAVVAVRAVVVDAVRYAKHVAYDGLGPEHEQLLAAKLADRLNVAYRYWDSGRSADVAEVRAELRRWADGRKAQPRISRP